MPIKSTITYVSKHETDDIVWAYWKAFWLLLYTNMTTVILQDTITSKVLLGTHKLKKLPPTHFPNFKSKQLDGNRFNLQRIHHSQNITH